ncbi:MAG: DUF998 domain-containing protein [Terracidiphilus sp.]|jgi:hypothetical protein
MSQPNPMNSPAFVGSGVRRSGLQKTLLAAGFSGVVFFSVFTILGALAPNYNFARDTISALEFTPLSVAQRANFLVFGLLLCAFAAGLRRELDHGRDALLIPLFQLFSGIGVIGDAVFIYEPLHLVCDLIAFNSGLLVLFTFAWRFRRDGRWKGWSAYSLVTAILMMGFLAAFGAANHLGGPAGLLEKLAASTRTLWSAFLAARLLRGARLDQRQESRLKTR